MIACMALSAFGGAAAFASADTRASAGMSLLLPSSYEQYMELNDPSDYTENDDYIAVADGSRIYLYDKEAGGAYAAFDAGDALNAAVLDDVGSLRRPGRDRAQTRHHHEGEVFAHRHGRIAVGQKRFEAGAFIVGQSAFGVHKMHEAARDRFDKGRNLTQRRERTGRAEVRKSQTALEFENRSDLLVHCRKWLHGII